jgi:hypothetical protein
VPSARVLVTNLHNLTQPLIRYELTDRFTRPQSTSAAGWLHASMDGRADEVFRYGTVAVHPHVIRSVLAAEAAAREYQVRQTGNGIKVACVTGGDLDAAALAAWCCPVRTRWLVRCAPVSAVTRAHLVASFAEGFRAHPVLRLRTREPHRGPGGRGRRVRAGIPGAAGS